MNIVGPSPLELSFRDKHRENHKNRQRHNGNGNAQYQSVSGPNLSLFDSFIHPVIMPGGQYHYQTTKSHHGHADRHGHSAAGEW